MKPIFAEEAKRRQGERNDIQENFPGSSDGFGKARDMAAKSLNISGRILI